MISPFPFDALFVRVHLIKFKTRYRRTFYLPANTEKFLDTYRKNLLRAIIIKTRSSRLTYISSRLVRKKKIGSFPIKT